MVAFVVLLQAQGYRFDWQAKSFEATSSLILSFQPESAQVWLDGVLKGAGPLTLHKLRAGLHAVTVTAPNYHVWQKTVYLTAGMVASLDDIILVPQDIPHKLVMEGLKNIKTNPRSKYGFVKDGEQWLLVDLGDEEMKPRQFSKVPIKELEELSWSPLGSRVLLKGKDAAGQTHLQLISLVSLQSTVLPELRFWRQLSWLGENSFLGLDDGAVYLYDLATKKQKQLADKVEQFAWANAQLYLLNKEGLWRRNLTNARLQAVDKPSFAISELIAQADWLVLASPKSEQKLILAASGEQWQLAAEKFLVRNATELFLADQGEILRLDQGKKQPEFLTRFSKPIQGLALLPTGMLAVLAGDNVYLLNPKHGDSYFVATCQEQLNFWQNLLYCQQGEKLYRLEL